MEAVYRHDFPGAATIRYHDGPVGLASVEVATVLDGEVRRRNTGSNRGDDALAWQRYELIPKARFSAQSVGGSESEAAPE